MKNLLSNVNDLIGKTAYQTYIIKHGFETFEVLVPVSKCEMFEAELTKDNINKSSILELVSEYGGEF